jgi:hypothetical protein
MEPTDFLIVEAEADWTQWMKTERRVRPPIIAVFQQREESACGFIARVGSRLDRLLKAATPLRRITLLGRDDWEISTLRARLAMLRKVRESGLPPGANVELCLEPMSTSATNPMAAAA